MALNQNRFTRAQNIMKMKTTVVLLVHGFLSVWVQILSAQVGTPPPSARLKQTAPALPPLPAGVTELKFNEFFVTPVGPRGLELTDKLHQLDGQRVRILGCMVRQEEAPGGSFLLAPIPAQVHEHENGLADDLPPSTLHVFSPSHREQAVPYTPQLLLLTGTLSVGNRTEADGRISTVRLTLDPAAKAATRPKAGSAGKGAERLFSRQKSTAIRMP